MKKYFKTALLTVAALTVHMTSQAAESHESQDKVKTESNTKDTSLGAMEQFERIAFAKGHRPASKTVHHPRGLLSTEEMAQEIVSQEILMIHASLEA